MTTFLVFIFLLQWETVVLDTVNSPSAIAYNNSHKIIVRYIMDSLYIVYEKNGDIYFISGIESLWHQPSDFSLPENISNTYPFSTHPAIAMDTSHGFLYCAFEEGGEIYLVKRDGTGNWSSPINISNSPSPYYSSTPVLEVNQNNHAVYIAWEETEQDCMLVVDIYFRRMSSNGNLSPIMDVSQTSYGSFIGYPTIWGVGDSFYVAWEQKPSGGYYEIYRRSYINETWGSTDNVSQTPNTDSRHPSFTCGLLENSVPTLVWEENNDIWAKSDDGWVNYNKSGTATISQYPTISTVGHKEGGYPTWAYLFWSESDTFIYGDTYYSMNYHSGSFNWTEAMVSWSDYGYFPNSSGASLIYVKPDTSSPKYLLYYTNFGYPIGVEENPQLTTWLKLTSTIVNHNATISYYIPTDTHVELSVYDIAGRKAATLVNNKVKAGTHHAILNTNTFAQGIYFAKLIAGQEQMVKKLMLIR